MARERTCCPGGLNLQTSIKCKTWFVHCVSRLFLPGMNPHFQGFPHPGHLPCRFRRAKNSVYKGMHVRMLELKFRHAQCTKCINLFKVSACSRGIVFCSHFQSSSLSVARRVLKLSLNSSEHASPQTDGQRGRSHGSDAQDFYDLVLSLLLLWQRIRALTVMSFSKILSVSVHMLPHVHLWWTIGAVLTGQHLLSKSIRHAAMLYHSWKDVRKMLICAEGPQLMVATPAPPRPPEDHYRGLCSSKLVLN